MDVLQRHHGLSKPAQNEFLRNPLVFAPGATNLLCQLTPITKVHDQAMDTVLEGHNKTQHVNQHDIHEACRKMICRSVAGCYFLLPSFRNHIPTTLKDRGLWSLTYLNISLGLETPACHDHTVRLRDVGHGCMLAMSSLTARPRNVSFAFNMHPASCNFSEHLCKNCHGSGRHRGDATMPAKWLPEICWIHRLYTGR